MPGDSQNKLPRDGGVLHQKPGRRVTPGLSKQAGVYLSPGCPVQSFSFS